MLYERHSAVLLAYALSLLRDRPAAEDVLHPVFMKLLQRKVVVNGQPLHYLYRAVRNTALNHRPLRRLQVSRGPPLTALPPLLRAMAFPARTPRGELWIPGRRLRLEQQRSRRGARRSRPRLCRADPGPPRRASRSLGG